MFIDALQDKFKTVLNNPTQGHCREGYQLVWHHQQSLLTGAWQRDQWMSMFWSWWRLSWGPGLLSWGHHDMQMLLWKPTTMRPLPLASSVMQLSWLAWKEIYVAFQISCYCTKLTIYLLSTYKLFKIGMWQHTNLLQPSCRCFSGTSNPILSSFTRMFSSLCLHLRLISCMSNHLKCRAVMDL